MIKKVEVIGVPIDFGSNRRGVDMGPSAIRYSGLKKAIQGLNHSYKDLGDIPVPLSDIVYECSNTSLKYLKEINKVNELLLMPIKPEN